MWRVSLVQSFLQPYALHVDYLGKCTIELPKPIFLEFTRTGMGLFICEYGCVPHQTVVTKMNGWEDIIAKFIGLCFKLKIVSHTWYVKPYMKTPQGIGYQFKPKSETTVVKANCSIGQMCNVIVHVYYW